MQNGEIPIGWSSTESVDGGKAGSRCEDHILGGRILQCYWNISWLPGVSTKPEQSGGRAARLPF